MSMYVSRTLKIVVEKVRRDGDVSKTAGTRFVIIHP